jgi:hypothetical protein
VYAAKVGILALQEAADGRFIVIRSAQIASKGAPRSCPFYGKQAALQPAFLSLLGQKPKNCCIFYKNFRPFNTFAQGFPPLKR